MIRCIKLQNKLTVATGVRPEEAIRWSLTKSKSLAPKVLWVLQYGNSIVYKHPKVLFYRQKLIQGLDAQGIPYIDLFENLIGAHAEAGKSLALGPVWSGHYSPRGNEVVCEVLASSLSLIQ